MSKQAMVGRFLALFVAGMLVVSGLPAAMESAGSSAAADPARACSGGTFAGTLNYNSPSEWVVWVPAGATVSVSGTFEMLQASWLGQWSTNVQVDPMKWVLIGGPGPQGYADTWTNNGVSRDVVFSVKQDYGSYTNYNLDVSVSTGNSGVGCLSDDENFGSNPAEPHVDEARGSEGDPVNTATGNFGFAQSDLAVAGRIPMVAARSYNSLDAATNGPFGYGWSSTYAMRIDLDPGGQLAKVVQESGARAPFTTTDGVTWTAPPRVRATLSHNGDGTWTFVRNATTVFTFNADRQLQSVADLNGNTIVLTYTGGRLATVADGTGRTLSFGWTGANVTSVSDSSTPARTVSFGYTNGDLTSVTDAGGGQWAFGYSSSSHLLTSVRDPRQAGGGANAPALKNSYDAAGRVTLQVNRNGKSTVFDYSSIPHATKITDPTGRIVVDYYTNGLRTMTTRGLGLPEQASWRFEYDPASLGVTKVTDPRGKVTTAVYDAAGNQRSVTDALNRTTSATYNSLNEPVTVADIAGTTTTFTYDAAGNMTSRAAPVVPSSPAQTVSVTYRHDDSAHPGDITSVIDPRGKTWSYGYNSFGLISSVTDPLGNTTRWADFTTAGLPQSQISARGNASGANANDFTTTTSYDAYGDVVSVTDPTGHTTVRSYDANRNLASVQDPGGNCQAAPKVRCTLYGYDSDDRLTSITRPDGSVLGSTYFDNDLLKQQIDAASSVTAYTYDGLGRLKSETDPTGNVTTYSYDQGGNLTAKQDPGGNCSAAPKVGCTTYAYDDASQLTSVTYSDPNTPSITAVTYDSGGRRSSTTNSTGAITSWAWDSLGRMISSTSDGKTTTYGYDLAGNVTSITYPGSATPVTRTYDDAGRWTGVNDGASRTTSFGYDADSDLTAVTYPGSVNVDTMTVDNAGRTTNTAFSKGATTLAAIGSPRVDDLGRVSAETLTSMPGSNSAYTYSPLGQLAQNNTNAYGYDAAGNVTQRGATYQGYNPASQICWTATTTASGCGAPPSGATTYGFDLRGNRTAQIRPNAPNSTFGFDQANRMVSASVPAVSGNEGQYHQVDPTRVMNTQAPYTIGTCVPSPCQTFTTTTPVKVKVAGLAGVPASGVEAVELNVSVWNTSALYAGGVSVWRSDGTQPSSPNLYFTTGTQVTNKVTTKLGADGYIAVSVNGTAEVSVDVVGWYSSATGTAGGTFVALDQARILDTRAASRTGLCPTTTAQCTTLIANTAKTVQVTGRGGVPASGVSAVAVNLTAVAPAADGLLKAYRTGSQPVPFVSTYYATAKTVSVASDLKPTNGQLDLIASSDLDVLIDVVGYWTSPTSQEGGQYIPLDPTQLVDTTAGSGTCTPSPCARIPAGGTLAVQVTGKAGLPTSGIRAVNINITTYNGSTTDAVQAYASDKPAPGLRTVAFAPGAFASNSVPVDVGADGKIKIKPLSATASVDVMISVQGYFSESGTLTWAYGYDNDGIRTSKTDPYGVTTTYTWDKANPAVPLLLTETTSGQTTRYIYGPGGVPVEQINPNGTVTYLHHDQLGSVRLTTNATGATIGAVTYAPYGNLAATSGALGTRFGFAGQYTDPETGFQYLRARYYDPGTAQFLSLDPLHNLTGERYGYTGGNPLNATDPTGMWAMGALRIIGQVAVFGAATLGAIACGATIVCGAAVGAAAGFGYYAAANAGSDRWSWTQAAGWAVAGGIAGGFGAATTATEPVPLYRAVSDAERADLAAGNGFRAGPNSYEGKLFATTPEDAASFGRINDSLTPGGEPFHIVETRVPGSALDSFEHLPMDGMPAVHVPEAQLGVLGPPTIWDSVPWAPKGVR